MPRDGQRYIYVVFSATGTCMGRAIRLLLRNRYNHVSVALDGGLRTLYSFARYHINSPIAGGFVYEYPQRILAGGREVFVKVCALPVDEAEHRRIRRELVSFCGRKAVLRYNTLSALLSLFRRHMPIRDTYTCVEFAAHLLNRPLAASLPLLEEALAPYEIYSGSFSEYLGEAGEYRDGFFIRRSPAGVAADTLLHFKELLARLVFVPH